jgi:hypothetical protein
VLLVTKKEKTRAEGVKRRTREGTGIGTGRCKMERNKRHEENKEEMEAVTIK